MALQVAPQQGWMVYRAYEPTPLTSFGFGGGRVLTFSLVPGWLGLLIDPLAGVQRPSAW